MVGVAQFIVLFAGPIGLVLLAAFVIARWVIGSRRRRAREMPQLEVVSGARAREARTPADDEPAAERPALRVVPPSPAGRPHEGP